MFQVNDKVFYGITGVCIVEKIDTPPISGVEGDYYFLQPVFDSRGLIYSPIDNIVPIRDVISEKECELILLKAANCYKDSLLNEKISFKDYDTLIKSQDSLQLLHLIRFLYNTKNERAKDLRKMKSQDNRTLLMAKKLLYGEMSVVLGRDYNDISEEMDGFLSSQQINE